MVLIRGHLGGQGVITTDELCWNENKKNGWILSCNYEDQRNKISQNKHIIIRKSTF